MFCHFWRLSPHEALSMPLGMRNEFTRYQNKYVKAQQQGRR